MGRTQIRTTELEDGGVKRNDLNTTVSGQAVTRKIVQGTGITLSSTGVDSGTGDVTISVTAGTYAAYSHSHNGDYCRWRGASAGDPGGAIGGDIFYDTNSGIFFTYDGSTWRDAFGTPLP